MQGVTQIGEQMVTHDDAQGLRSDSVDAMRDLEKRFKETQQALQQSQRAEADTKRDLKHSQRAEAETKKALQESGKHLTDEQNKNHRQGVVLARLNAEIKDTYDIVCTLRKAKSKLETENAQLETKLSDLQTLQTMQEDVHFLRMSMGVISEQVTNRTMQEDVRFLKLNMGMIIEQLTNKFKAQDEKQDEILLQGAGIMATVKRIGTLYDVAFSGDSGVKALNESDGEEDGVGCKRRRA
jgi:hypothetical protein